MTSYALWLLGKREYSRAELHQKIKNNIAKKNFIEKKENKHRYEQAVLSETEQSQLIDQILDYLTKEGLQDDNRFTASYIKQSIQKGWGPIKINYKLHTKGISREMVAEHLPKDDEFWQERALSIVSRNYSIPIIEPKQKSKCYRFLSGRGFASAHIRHILE